MAKKAMKIPFNTVFYYKNIKSTIKNPKLTPKHL